MATALTTSGRGAETATTGLHGLSLAEGTGEPAEDRREVDDRKVVIGRQSRQFGLGGPERAEAVGMVYGWREPGHVHAQTRAGQVDAHRDVRP